MKLVFATMAVLCLTGVLMAQDNPIPSVGTTGGSNLQTNNADVPYILGGGSGMYLKAKVDMASLGLRRPLATLGITFDLDGSFYFNTITSGVGPATNSGITKFNSSGVVQWTNQQPNGNGDGNAGAEPIVGGDYVYSHKVSNATGLVYALFKNTGATKWQTSLTSAVMMNPVLSNGYLYGVESNNMAFVVNASTGALVYESAALSGITTGAYERGTFVADAFGAGQNGLFWRGASTTNAINISTTGASVAWTQTNNNVGSNWNYNNNYNPTTNEIYKYQGAPSGGGGVPGAWGVTGVDPITGAAKWNFGDDVEGYEGRVVVTDPAKPGFIGSGQGQSPKRIDTTKTYFDPVDGITKIDMRATVQDINDPTQTIPNPNYAVVWDRTDLKSEWSMTNRSVLVNDPTTGRKVLVIGTEPLWDRTDPANPVLLKPHRLMGLDPDTGATIFQYNEPTDPEPKWDNYGGQIFRQLSVSPNGDIVYLNFATYTDPLHGSDPMYGPNGTLYIVSALAGDANDDHVVDTVDLNLVYNNLGTTGLLGGDVNGDGVVDTIDLNLVYNNLGLSVTPASLGSGAVPEPVTLVLLSLGGLALIRRNRK